MANVVTPSNAGATAILPTMPNAQLKEYWFKQLDFNRSTNFSFADESVITAKPGHMRNITYPNMTRNDVNKSQKNIAKSKRDSKKRLTALPSVRRIKLLIQSKD